MILSDLQPAPTVRLSSVGERLLLPLLMVEGETVDSAVVSFVNRACPPTFGPIQVGARLSEILSPVRTLLARSLAGEEMGAHEMVVIPPTGRRAVFLASATAVYRADRVSGAVFYAMDVTDHRRAERDLSVQHQVARILAEAESFTAAAPKVLQAIGCELGWDDGSLWTLSPDEQELLCSARWCRPGRQEPCALRRERLQCGEGLPGRVWDSGQPVWISDCLLEGDIPRRDEMAAGGLHTMLGFPIVLQGKVLGVFEFFDREVLAPDPELIRTMATLGSQLGQFIKRRRYETDLRNAHLREQGIAARFQAALLPTDPTSLPGYRAAFSYRPALREADVGGDFYNLFRLDEERVGLVIGDVGGKGLEAAVIAACLQQAIVALTLRPGATPASVLDDSHRFLSSLRFDGIVTVFLGILEQGTGQLAYCNAGHEPPLVYRAVHRACEPLCTGQPALVGLELGPYASQSVRLDVRDVLFLYTDGLTEAGIRPDGLLGTDGVARLLEAHSDHEPAEILTHMCRTATQLSSGRLQDDIAMAAIRRMASLDAEPRPIIWHRCRLSEPCCC